MPEFSNHFGLVRITSLAAGKFGGIYEADLGRYRYHAIAID
jgi:hypothetical protein